MHGQKLDRQDEIVFARKSCRSSEWVTLEVAGVVPPSEQLDVRVEGAAERVLYPRVREGVQGEHPGVTEDQFEAFVRATHSINESE